MNTYTILRTSYRVDQVANGPCVHQDVSGKWYLQNSSWAPFGYLIVLCTKDPKYDYGYYTELIPDAVIAAIALKKLGL